MYEVLMAVDRDESRATSQANTISDLPHAADDVRATIVHVSTDNVEGASVAQVGSVRKASETLEDAGVDVELLGESGDPATEILDAAAEEDVDLLSVAGRKRTPAGKALFGSVTQAVILNTDRPVLVSPRV